jgi:hypothetical protein
MDNFKQMQRDSALSVLRMRETAQAELLDAESRGDKKEVRTWQKHLKGVNKLISSYGLDRYAHRT